ncbi:hypothetical protein BEN47_13010 [Hymenobacter lapidarius]|uniref:DUF1206 domain-containing protein n=1 Tax=Hymenobacter lapidarius TaxID=1908237 RepID=A0A1G1T6S3_9BACT|nr:DUF1206 domain-containing protein [Hymenobacter lapidarius]OGX86567.1 hypothetical protein BEN47_13010 [Hymenobacter lapidarius]
MSAASTLLSAVPKSPASGIKTMARLGFAAIGVVYLLMGVLALLAVTGLGSGARADKKEAVQHLQDLPAGNVLLGFIAFGLLGYIIWRFTQAIRDTESKGHGAKGIARRLWFAASGLFYSGLALYAGRLALNSRADQGGNTSQSLTAKVLGWPGGDWLILLIGLVVIGIAVYQVYRAYSGQFQKDVNASCLPASQQNIVYRTGQIGYTARGIVLGIIGYFLVQAGRQSRAGAVGDTGEAFDFLAAMSPAVLGTVAAGLVAYGIHMLVQAKYPVLRGI